MKYHLQNTLVTFARLDRRHVQLLVLVGTLILFVLAGGAPEGGGCSGC